MSENDLSSTKTKPFLLLIPLTLLVCTALILVQLKINNLLFPASSDVAYLVVAVLACMASTFFLNIQNRLQTNYIFSLCLIAIVMLIYSQTFESPKGDGAMLTSIWAQLFFLSRPAALGLAISTFVGYLLQVYRRDGKLESHCHLLSLLAGFAYLGGEIAGSYWAFIGWGRSWSWSGHFFVSAFTYLLFILVFHLPKAWFINPKQRAIGKATVMGSICLLMLGYKLL